MDAAESEHGVLLGSAVRPLLIYIILRLRSDLNTVTVGGAVERIVLSGEEAKDTAIFWQEAERVVSELLITDLTR